MPNMIDTNVLYAAMVGERSSAGELATEYCNTSCIIPDAVLVECLNLARCRAFSQAKAITGRLTESDRKAVHTAIYKKLVGVLACYKWDVVDKTIVQAQHLCTRTGLDLVDCWLILHGTPCIITADKALLRWSKDMLVSLFIIWLAVNVDADLNVAEMVLKMHPELKPADMTLQDYQQLVRECEELLKT